MSGHSLILKQSMINTLPLEFQHHLFRENIMFFNYYFIHIINKNNMSRSRLDDFIRRKRRRCLKSTIWKNANLSLSQTSKFWFPKSDTWVYRWRISVIPSEICRRLTNAAKHCLNENGEQKIRQEFTEEEIA